MATRLNGLRATPLSGRKAASLVVLLHGYGADARDLFPLADRFAGVLPDAAFAAPNAPEPCEMGGSGFQWFGLMTARGSIELRAAGADAAAPLLRDYLDSELAYHELDGSRLALVGFSQGTLMALHVGLRLPKAPAAIVGFSGMLAAPERLAAERTGDPPILLVHGTDDPIVPFARLAEAAASLAESGTAPETLIRPGLPHGIDEPALEAASQFLKRHVASSAAQA